MSDHSGSHQRRQPRSVLIAGLAGGRKGARTSFWGRAPPSAGRIAGSGSTHDTIQFAANDFGSFAAVQSAMSQVGSDVLIRLDATDSIVLNGVILSNLVAADFKFV